MGAGVRWCLSSWIKLWWKSFSLESGPLFWDVLHKWSLFSSRCQIHMGIFLEFLPSEPNENLGGKNPWKFYLSLPLQTWPSEVSDFHTSITQPRTVLQNYHWTLLTSLWLQQPFLQVSISQLWLSWFVHLFRYQDDSLSCSLSSLMYPRKVTDFQLLEHFLVARMGATTFKLS